jgi:hypothetical protein
MEFLQELLLPGNTSLAATLVLLSFVIAVGIYLGKIRFWGVSLGVTFVLFVGILMGHFGYEIQPEVLKFVREFGLIRNRPASRPGLLLIVQKRGHTAEHARCARNHAKRRHSCGHILHQR